MAIAVSEVKHRIASAGLTVAMVAEKLGIDESTYYRKMSNKGDTFTVRQIQELKNLLDLSSTEAREIFFP